MSLLSDIRLDIGDDGATERFTDAQIYSFIEKAARRVNRVLSLADGDALIVDSSGNITQPLPTSDTLHDILLLQSECLIYARDINSSVTGGTAGIVVTDGEQKIDTTDRATVFGDNKDALYAPCVELEKAILQARLEGFTPYDIW